MGQWLPLKSNHLILAFILIWGRLVELMVFHIGQQRYSSLELTQIVMEEVTTILITAYIKLTLQIAFVSPEFSWIIYVAIINFI